jgi:hypothetical protein
MHPAVEVLLEEMERSPEKSLRRLDGKTAGQPGY